MFTADRTATRPWFSYPAVAAVAFLIGSAVPHPSSIETNANAMQKQDKPTARVTGIGGIFFKTADPASLREWYRDHLGIESDEWGGFAFQWREKDRPDEAGYTVWGPFAEKTEYFDPSEQPYMLNYRVADMDGLLAALQEEGVEIVGEVQVEPNGKFAWIMDPEGRKIELWEPVPSAEDPYLE